MKKLGFGTMRFPLLDPNDNTKVDLEQVKQMVDDFLAAGFTYFDTAYMYHTFKSECFVKEALVERYPRESFILADKMPTMKLEKEGDEKALHREGHRGGTWVLLDYGCIVVHVFNNEAREFYSLERLWRDGKPLDLSGVLQPD